MNVNPQKEAVITVRVLEGAADIKIKDSVEVLFSDKLNSEDRSYQDYNIETVAHPNEDELE